MGKHELPFPFGATGLAGSPGVDRGPSRLTRWSSAIEPRRTDVALRQEHQLNRERVGHFGRRLAWSRVLSRRSGGRGWPRSDITTVVTEQSPPVGLSPTGTSASIAAKTPSLHLLRLQLPGVVRRLLRYIGSVRLPLSVHHRRVSLDFCSFERCTAANKRRPRIYRK